MKRHAHPYESEFEHWTRQWRRKQHIKRALFWIGYLVILTLFVAIVIRSLGTL